MVGEIHVVRFLVVLLILLVLSFMGSLFLVAALNGTLSFPDISISDAYTADPTRAEAAYMIPVSAFVFVLIAISRISRMSLFVYRQADIWTFSLLIVSVFFIFISACGVAAVPLSSEYTVHVVSAITLFISGGVFIGAVTWLDDRLDFDRPQLLRNFRIATAIVLILTGLALAITSELTDAAAGVLEIVLVLLFLLYIASWVHRSEFPLESKSLPARLTSIQSDLSLPPISSV
jgi:hypothetical protein